MADPATLSLGVALCLSIAALVGVGVYLAYRKPRG